MKANKYFSILIILIFTTVFHQSQAITISLPVPKQLIIRVSLSIQKLQQLLKNFNTKHQNKLQIYKRVQITKKYLNQLKKPLAQYNNILAGSGNMVNGNKNLVIGNYNNVNGNNNWIFISKYTGNVNGDLIVGEWRVQLDKAFLILINTKFVISYIDEDRNKGFGKYSKQSRQLFKWDKWAHAQNQKSDQHWRKYNGYNQWKTNNGNKKNLQSQNKSKNENKLKNTGWLGGFNWGK